MSSYPAHLRSGERSPDGAANQVGTLPPASARQITAVNPYYGLMPAPTAKPAGRESITAKLVARCCLVEPRGWTGCLGHGLAIPPQIQGYFDHSL